MFIDPAIIIDIRDKVGFSNKELSYILGIKPQSLANKLSKRSKFSISDLFNIANHCDYGEIRFKSDSKGDRKERFILWIHLTNRDGKHKGYFERFVVYKENDG